MTAAVIPVETWRAIGQNWVEDHYLVIVWKAVPVGISCVEGGGWHSARLIHVVVAVTPKERLRAISPEV